MTILRAMTRDIRVARDRLGLNTRELADLVGVTTRAAERWIAGSIEVPEPVWRILEIIQVEWRCHPDYLTWLELPWVPTRLHA